MGSGAVGCGRVRAGSAGFSWVQLGLGGFSWGFGNLFWRVSKDKSLSFLLVLTSLRRGSVSVTISRTFRSKCGTFAQETTLPTFSPKHYRAMKALNGSAHFSWDGRTLLRSRESEARYVNIYEYYDSRALQVCLSLWSRVSVIDVNIWKLSSHSHLDDLPCVQIMGECRSVNKASED